MVTRFRTRPTESVFAYLALHVGKDVSRDRLISIAWPDADEESGRRSLRTALSDIRQRLGHDAVTADRVMVRLERTAVDVDVDRFLKSRDPSDCPGKLLEAFSDPWLVPFSIDLDDAYGQAVIGHMDSLSLEEAAKLAAECLSRDPSRLDVRSKLRELGLEGEVSASPHVTSSFVGREREIGEIMALIRSNRLLTLTGLGGSGKTRLAGEVWSRHCPESWFVPLADLNEGNQIADGIRHRLKLPHSTQRSPLEQVIYGLESSTGLLVLDNFEHVLSGAGLVAELLERCPTLHVLVTSQVPLGLEAEVEYPVGPLEVAGQNGEPLSEAMLLFEARARAVLPSFTITQDNHGQVHELCQRLDGFPLALEIAAAKSRVFSPREMVDQLEDRFAFLTKRGSNETTKHGSLRTALDWSFERLADAEQTLLTELTIFRGGFTLEAVADVTSQPRPDTLIDNLLVHSWVERVDGTSPQRFRMLESIREFGSELLPPRRREELSRAHASYYLQLARATYDAAFQPHEPDLHRTVDAESHNLDAAWLWLRTHDPEANLSLIVWLNWYFVLRGLSHIAEARIKEAISQVAPEPRDVLCFSFHCCGNFIISQGRYAEAETWFVQGGAMARVLGDKFKEGVSLVQLAWLKAELGEFASAEECIRRAIDLQMLTGDSNWIGSAYCVATLIANRQGDPNEALRLGKISLEHCRAGGYAWGLASVLNELAFAYRMAGDLDASLSHELESIHIKRELSAPKSLAVSLAGLAATLLALDRTAEAKANLQEAFRILKSLGETTSLPSIFGTAASVAERVHAADLAATARSLEEQLSVGKKSLVLRTAQGSLSAIGEFREKPTAHGVASSFIDKFAAL